MLRKVLAPFRRLDWPGAAARLGALAARARPAARPFAFASAFAFVVLLVHREVYSFITQRTQFTVPTIRTAVAPRWADSQGVEIVQVDSGGASLFDRGVVERVGRAFEDCPWVRKVTAVERVYPNQLLVRFEYRRPHLAFRRANGYVVIDAQGVRLPGVYVEPPPCDRSVRISGLNAMPPEPGRPWADPGVRAALEMADLVHGNPLLQRLAVREIDLSNLGGRLDARRSEVALVTSSGCSLDWGRLPSAGKFGDLASEEKLENLREVLAVYPDLDGLRRVKLYFKGTRAVEPKEPWARGPKVQRPR
jgi:hypothetical protein